MRKHPMEILWLSTSAMCLIVAIIRNIRFGFGEAQAMYFFAGASLLMFLWRRHLRKKDGQDGG